VVTLTSAQEAAAAMHRFADRVEDGPAEERLAVLEARVSMLTAAVAALVADRAGYDLEEP
jgi:hypothetical protein